jgi:hypothetical protein
MEGTRTLRGVPDPTLTHTGLEGTRPLRGQPYPTFQCGQNLKVKINLFISASANLFISAKQKPPCFDFDFDFDFNILTAFIRLGRAGPVGAGCPPYYADSLP